MVLDAAVTDVGAAAKTNGVKLTEEVPPELSRIWADAAALSDALGQLLENAGKLTPRGGQVIVTAGRIEGQSDSLVFGQPGIGPERHTTQLPDCRRTGGFVETTMRDAGAGIPAEAIPRIFDRFYQADSSATRRHGGTGQGLAIVKRVLDAHGASITVESHPGHGTTFCLRLPAAA